MHPVFFAAPFVLFGNSPGLAHIVAPTPKLAGAIVEVVGKIQFTTQVPIRVAEPNGKTRLVSTWRLNKNRDRNTLVYSGDKFTIIQEKGVSASVTIRYFGATQQKKITANFQVPDQSADARLPWESVFLRTDMGGLKRGPAEPISPAKDSLLRASECWIQWAPRPGRLRITISAGTAQEVFSANVDANIGWYETDELKKALSGQVLPRTTQSCSLSLEFGEGGSSQTSFFVAPAEAERSQQTRMERFMTFPNSFERLETVVKMVDEGFYNDAYLCAAILACRYPESISIAKLCSELSERTNQPTKHDYFSKVVASLEQLTVQDASFDRPCLANIMSMASAASSIQEYVVREQQLTTRCKLSAMLDIWSSVDGRKVLNLLTGIPSLPSIFATGVAGLLALNLHEFACPQDAVWAAGIGYESAKSGIAQGAKEAPDMTAAVIQSSLQYSMYLAEAGNASESDKVALELDSLVDLRRTPAIVRMGVLAAHARARFIHGDFVGAEALSSEGIKLAKQETELTRLQQFPYWQRAASKAKLGRYAEAFEDFDTVGNLLLASGGSDKSVEYGLTLTRNALHASSKPVLANLQVKETVEQPKTTAIIVSVEHNVHGWSDLPNTVREARELRAKLASEFGVDAVLLSDPTKAVFAKTVIEARSKLRRGEQLFVYVACHGGTFGTEASPHGYLVLQDTGPATTGEPPANCLPLQTIRSLLAGAEGQTFLVLASCRSGNLMDNWDPALSTEMFGAPNRGESNFEARTSIAKALSQPCAFALCASRGDVSDGKSGELSPFASAFLKSLVVPAGKQFVTMSDVAGLTFSSLQADSGSERPVFGRFSFGEGAFVFVKKRSND